jgi:hypothetical protein
VVAYQAGYVIGNEPADRSAGVHADQNPAGWVEHEPGGLEVDRVVVDKRASGVGYGAGERAVTDREPQPCLAMSV